MKNEKIIDFMLDELENSGRIAHSKNKEYVRCSRNQQKQGELLYDFIEKNIKPENVKNNLRSLLENYIDSTHSTYYCEYKTFYRFGFMDGIDFAKD